MKEYGKILRWLRYKKKDHSLQHKAEEAMQPYVYEYKKIVEGANFNFKEKLFHETMEQLIEQYKKYYKTYLPKSKLRQLKQQIKENKKSKDVSSKSRLLAVKFNKNRKKVWVKIRCGRKLYTGYLK